MKRKVEFRIENVTFFYNKPPKADLLTLKKKIRNEGYKDKEDAEFIGRVAEKYVTVRIGFLTRKVTNDFPFKNHPKAFADEFINKLCTILI